MRDNAVEITRHAFRNRRDFREFKEFLQSGGFLSEDVCPPKTKKKKKVEPAPTLRIIRKVLLVWCVKGQDDAYPATVLFEAPKNSVL